MLALVWWLSLKTLPNFQEVMYGFEIELPVWIELVYGSYQYWWIFAALMFTLLIVSFVPVLEASVVFQTASKRLAMAGYFISALLLVISIAAIYVPVFQKV
jgi:hypothetical protein